MQHSGSAFIAVVLTLALCTAVAARPFPQQPPACFDGTPHEERRVRVDDNVRLQVLDWGGRGKPRTMVLLTGLGDNAHVYDEFAYQFTDFFHVIGITRRGFLPSSQPAPGRRGGTYDVDDRARDDIAVLDALRIGKAVFVGHSVAGSELSALGSKFADRVDALVYLDAFDLSKRFDLPDLPPPPYTDADGRSLETLLAAVQRLEDVPRPAPAVCIGLRFNRRGTITGSTTSPAVSAAILQGVRSPANPPTDWASIAAPRLGIFDRPSIEGRLPYYPYLDDADKALFDANWPAIVDWYAKGIAAFSAQQAGRPTPVVRTLPDAPHYFYLNHQAFVVLAMREFLLGSVNP